MKIVITMNVDDEYADPDHKMGITEQGYNLLTDLLSNMGDNIDVTKDPS